MPSTYTSPYASSFKSAVKRGTSYNVVVNNIAKRHNKNPQIIWASLFKANLCFRQKFNGQWIYFPCVISKTSSTTAKIGQHNMWQWFCEWCLTSGVCTPQQLKSKCGSQKEFMTFCRKFFGKQFTTTSSTTRGRKRTVSKSTTRTFKIPTTRTRSRRYLRAA